MNWYKYCTNINELINIGVEIQNGKAILYRGTNIKGLTQKDLRYGDYLSSVENGIDATGNAGANSYGKYILRYEIPIKDIKITNGELQYIGISKSLKGVNKYPLKIYKAFNDYHGSNYTSEEIDKMDANSVRSSASPALSGGREEFDSLMLRHIK